MISHLSRAGDKSIGDFRGINPLMRSKAALENSAIIARNAINARLWEDLNYVKIVRATLLT
jgi:CHASE1-domain containing sensor protein